MTRLEYQQALDTLEMDDFFRLKRSDLLNAPKEPAPENKLADESWGSWIENNKILTGVTVTAGLVALTLGGRALTRLLAKDAVSVTEASSAKLLNLESGAVGFMGTSKIASGAAILPEARVVGAGISEGVSLNTATRVGSVVGTTEAAALGRSSLSVNQVAPGFGKSEAYSWGAEAPALGDPIASAGSRDSLAFLERLAAGDMTVLPKSASVFERGMAQIRKEPTIATAASAAEHLSSVQATGGLQSLEGTVIAGTAEQPAGAAISQWLPLHSMKSDVTITAPRGISEGTAELLGYERAAGTRPVLDEIIVDTSKATRHRPFSRFMPAIGRMEIPALSVRRKSSGFGL